MAERKSGPVKPPVIDLTARPAAEAKPAARPADAAKPVKPAIAPAAESAASKPDAEPAPPPKKPDAPKPASSQRSAVLGAVGGAVLATAICYGLASAGLWPSTSAATDAHVADLQSRLAQSDKSNAAATSALADVNTRLAALETDFTAKIAASTDGLAAVQKSVDALGSAKPAAPDLGPVQAELKTLGARVDAVAAGASSADAGALAANLATVQQTLHDLEGKLAALDTRAGATDSAVSGLKTELDTAKAAIDQAAAAPSPKTIASAMQLPLQISALEADFAAGRPYQPDLDAIKAAQPEAHIPASVTDAAATGLPGPDDFARSLDARLPDMLAARPASTDSSWQGQMGDWVKGMLALRPSGEQDGDTPEALLSRLAGAAHRHDFAAAAKLYAQLPPPMQQAAGDLGPKLSALADADSFVAGLRSAALAPATGAPR